ncbi:sialate O-acetylesterase [Tautonia sociabilis]|uniref:Sialate O-acetylesterase n=1 Tax=Tautonia sociabilis TaxID=2080755 RepID=A0A432MJV4_9BACT|nr:sialate O-acetylesterase [Tautonia sociabilis]RUL87465.1 sialate O-acetylesterase [Tautonia sociabilis]
MLRRTFLATAAIAALGAALPAAAELSPNPIFSDGMVLQRGTTVPIWGTADDGAEVTVTFRGQTATATADGGKWQARLHDLEAGGPDELTISSGGETITIKDVLVGEVWVCSGQSNMQWTVANSADPETVIANAKDDQLRLLTVPRVGTAEPQDRVDVSWSPTTPETIPGFSAVAYHFGKTLRAELGVPVGLISTNYGGTPAEAWTAREALAADPLLKPILDRPLHERESHRPGWLYNAMIHPIVPFAIAGAIWYQGESNAGRAYEYRTLFPAMIRNWRNAWGRGDFPFLLVQLAPFMKIEEQPTESAWAELREAQLMSTQVLRNVGMAVITDVGEQDDIHPKQKEPVGIRLALAALALGYDQDVCYSGPTLKSARFEDGKAILTFDHTCGGLVAKDGSLTGFTIAGADRKFVNASAEIVSEDTIEVSSPEVERPASVRFGWANFPVVNLFNEAGLPASPFRTDDWPGVTGP